MQKPYSATRSAMASISRPTGWRSILVHSSPVDTRSTTPHSQIAVASRSERAASPMRPLVPVAVEELERVLSHEDPHVVFRFSQQAVWVDQLEAVSCLQGVPFVHVSMHEHGTVVVVRGDATCRARERVLDGALGARAVELLPHNRDGINEPATLVGAGGQATAGRRAPYARRG